MTSPKPFNLPPRTRTTFRANVPLTREQSLELLSGQVTVAFDNIPLEQYDEFFCIDCGFATRDVLEMFRHQNNQAQYHTFWQRVRRCWDVWRKTGDRTF